MEISVQFKNVYGNEMIYPMCDKAHIFAKLAGKKTFSYNDLENVRALGYNVNVCATNGVIINRFMAK